MEFFHKAMPKKSKKIREKMRKGSSKGKYGETRFGIRVEKGKIIFENEF
ncbi:MAG: hypothetical protein HZA13_01130 [Nitrospirae bacterium]|nr:hypothetical protein [Nitrospirota bacterium]